MHKIAMFLEDRAHREVVSAIVRKIASEQNTEVDLDPRNSTGGFPKVVGELEIYFRDLRLSALQHDVIVVAADANCHGVQKRKQELQEKAAQTQGLPEIIYALPDPHIERWLLIDSQAFKKVCGKGCSAPDKKCDRGRYKKKLIDALISSKQDPGLGGIDYAEAIISEMSLAPLPQDDSFKLFITDLRSYFRRNLR